ncbi:T9SS type A sorting domain-containing protein [uncultured Chryseobacterium sp.]|uniref:T9SS type A sorting domain-containing protein n=1 Tax=uncultured Chryseobacterium sp. TaxID=259322 RepID=UPI0025FB9688|nr:T9SS type A sorting domain-containing protein [uncultured Chryseobacterium sp.]
MRIIQLLSKTFLLLLFLSGVYSFSQTSIKVTYYTGSSQDYTITAGGKLYFSGNNLLVKTSGSAADVSIPTGIIKKITFASSVLALRETEASKNQILLYPNPSADFIRISSGEKDPLKVKIFSVEGRLVLSGTFHSGEDIDISSLQQGFYLVQVNTNIIKLIKK